MRPLAVGITERVRQDVARDGTHREPSSQFVGPDEIS